MNTAKGELAAGFPQLDEASFEITSPQDPDYNCIAWAAGDDSSWWWPDPWAGPPLGGLYWPAGVPKSRSLSSFVQAFRRQGYRECDDGSLEVGFEKVAVYVDEAGEPTHAARQLPDGRWTSKLGRDHDIAHDTPEGVGGHQDDGYGDVAQYLRRKIVSGRPGPGVSDAAFGGGRP